MQRQETLRTEETPDALEYQPYSSKLFVGREKIITYIQTQTTQEQPEKSIQLIMGPPGIGKTWLIRHLEHVLHESDKAGELAVFRINGKTLSDTMEGMRLKEWSEHGVWTILQSAVVIDNHISIPGNTAPTIPETLIYTQKNHIRPILLIENGNNLLPGPNQLSKYKPNSPSEKAYVYPSPPSIEKEMQYHLVDQNLIKAWVEAGGMVVIETSENQHLESQKLEAKTDKHILTPLSQEDTQKQINLFSPSNKPGTSGAIYDFSLGIPAVTTEILSMLNQTPSLDLIANRIQNLIRGRGGDRIKVWISEKTGKFEQAFDVLCLQQWITPQDILNVLKEQDLIMPGEEPRLGDLARVFYVNKLLDYTQGHFRQGTFLKIWDRILTTQNPAWVLAQTENLLDEKVNELRSLQHSETKSNTEIPDQIALTLIEALYLTVNLHRKSLLSGIHSTDLRNLNKDINVILRAAKRSKTKGDLRKFSQMFTDEEELRRLLGPALTSKIDDFIINFGRKK